MLFEPVRVSAWYSTGIFVTQVRRKVFFTSLVLKLHLCLSVSMWEFDVLWDVWKHLKKIKDIW